MRRVPLAAGALAVALFASAAEAGAPIKKLPGCEHAYLFPFGESTAKADFRDGLLADQRGA